jgi:hypothetical protein
VLFSLSPDYRLIRVFIGVMYYFYLFSKNRPMFESRLVSNAASSRVLDQYLGRADLPCELSQFDALVLD